jgi:hypothetical protein
MAYTKVGKGFSPLKHPPSFYFQRQCYISVDPDEKTTAAMVELLGENAAKIYCLPM